MSKVSVSLTDRRLFCQVQTISLDQEEDAVTTSTIDAKLLAGMFIAGAANLEANKEWINELNVFPVPDGDTGTNMTLTIKSAVSEVSALGDAFTMTDICKAMSSGSLRGARGNSGVILSQLIRGFGKVAKSENELTIPVLADAFDRAVETAYKAVMKPKEGTILTVAKGASLKSRELADNGEEDLEKYLGEVLAEAEKVLAETPELLPVLKQAGVVDSGGQGLVQVMKGAYDKFLGKEIEYAVPAEDEEEKGENKAEKDLQEAEPLRFIYKMRMTVLMSKKPSSRDQKEYLEFLKSLGDRVKCAAEDNVLHVRIRTNDPGLIIQRSQKFGELGEVRLLNLREAESSARSAEPESEKADKKRPEPEIPPQPRKDVGLITVSVGDGIAEIFTGLGVDYVISGGQTMNPSTDDVLKAVEKVNADTIFVLPNNKNIIMAANQAASLTTDKKVVVIPTTTVPQGITAVINYMPDLDSEANKVTKDLHGEITYVEDKDGNPVDVVVYRTAIGWKKADDAMSDGDSPSPTIPDGKVGIAVNDPDDNTIAVTLNISEDDIAIDLGTFPDEAD